MKTIKFVLATFILAGVIFACEQKPSSIEETEIATSEKPISKVPTFTSLSKDTFDVWITRWDNNFRNYVANDSMHYFEMPIVDLSAILTEKPLDNARLYFGMNSALNPHLMLVGVADGKIDYNIIADYTRLCPPHCK